MEKKSEHKHCFVCHFCGEDRVMLPCEYEGEHRWVCVSCLPPLIHGVHMHGEEHTHGPRGFREED